MKLKKALLDIPAADGLAQKTDVRRLPMGKSAAAINLVKNKQGRLEKRLGFTPLAKTAIDTNSTTWTQGITVGSWNTRPLGIGQGTWNLTAVPQTVVDLKTYSDDTNKWKNRGLIPEMIVVEDEIIADAPTHASCPTSIIYGDYKMIAWLGTDASGNQYVYYCVREVSTGLYVQPPQLAQPSGSVNNNIACMQLILVGTKAVLVYGGSTNIFCSVLDQSVWTTTTLASVGENLVISNNSAGIFDAASVGGDNGNFLIGCEIAPGGVREVVITKISTSLVVAVTTGVLAVASVFGTASGPYAIRADTTSGVAFAYGITASPNAIRASTLTYPALAVAASDTAIYTASGSENLPAAMALGFCGKILFNTPMWLLAWTPGGSAFNYNINLNGHFASAPQTFNNARVNTQQFLVNGGSILLPNTSPRFTPGLHLVSRLLETNGILYYVGWIPSTTQGGYLVMALDYTVNTTDATAKNDSGQYINPWCARPVANLQTRTALAPFQQVVWSTSPFTNTSINTMTNLANWNFESPTQDFYGTVDVCYLATTQGARTMPATGRLRTQMKSGYQMCQYGTLTAIGGGIPTLFDGTNIFEQNFLYAPDTIGWTNTAGSGPQWTSATGVVNYIITYEQFDSDGNFHSSARSLPISIKGSDVGWSSGTLTQKIILYVPTLGPTMRQYPFPMTLSPFMNTPPPSAPVNIGIWRTQENGSVYFRVTDRFYNGADITFPGVVNTQAATTVTYADNICSEANLIDGSHPLLYGDGSNGQPGALDDFCPPASSLMIRHKERLFVARGNLVQYTKARAELVGPGYNDQLDSFFVGGDDPIVAMESMDDKLVIFKAQQCFYIGGDGPGDDGSGNSFTPPQPVPTDSGCIDYRSVRATPEGVYFQSQAGYRLFTRSLAVEYVGGPVEDELAVNSVVTGAVLYPSNNKLILCICNTDFGISSSAEMLNRDYVLDAWTTALIQDGESTVGPIMSAAVATASQITGLNETLHLMMTDGRVWRENDPRSVKAYLDNNTYVNGSWQTPWIKQGDQGRFRVWDLWAIMQNMDPCGLTIAIAIDYGIIGNTRFWTWTGTANTLSNLVGPGSTLRVGLYDGRMVEAFQLVIVDVSDPATISGRGMQYLGFTASIGNLPGPFKGPPGAQQ